MEVMIFIIFFSLVFITTFALWKYVRLKHDVYEYTEKLDNTINYMLKNGELKTTPYENDDLWEKIYEKLVRLSHLYTHKNLEISEEKDKLKELVSDISHQTKTPIANIKLYLEIEVHDKEGIGIGLYLAREIITLQNGYIEVQSQIGQGSKFIIYLPNRD